MPGGSTLLSLKVTAQFAKVMQTVMVPCWVRSLPFQWHKLRESTQPANREKSTRSEFWQTAHLSWNSHKQLPTGWERSTGGATTSTSTHKATSLRVVAEQSEIRPWNRNRMAPCVTFPSLFFPFHHPLSSPILLMISSLSPVANDSWLGWLAA